mmetsp:Transcript_24525/g.80378  ORF Transcript_24525/g.80378 Transcript_24525/m.80378 type:complete len:99 (+) Transcript_24525:25-321(+)
MAGRKMIVPEIMTEEQERQDNDELHKSFLDENWARPHSATVRRKAESIAFCNIADKLTIQESYPCRLVEAHARVCRMSRAGGSMAGTWRTPSTTSFTS